MALLTIAMLLLAMALLPLLVGSFCAWLEHEAQHHA